MLEEAHALDKRGVDVVLGFIETHGRAETAALIDGLELVPRTSIEYRGVQVEEMDLDGVLARRPAVAVVDEIAHTNVPGSRNRKRYQDVLELHRRRHQRDRRVQHPAPGLAQRPGRARDRRGGARDGAGQLPQAGGPGGQPRPGGGRSSRTPAQRQDLHGGQGGLGAGALLRAVEPVDPARAGPARGGREPGAGQRGAHAAGRQGRRAARLRPGHGLHVVLPAARRRAAPARLAQRRPAQHRLVRGLRGDAGRGADPHRRRGAAPSAVQHRARPRAGRGSGAAAGARPGDRAHRLRPLARGRPHHHRALAPALVAAGAGPLGAAAPGARGLRLRPAHRVAARRRTSGHDLPRPAASGPGPAGGGAGPCRRGRRRDDAVARAQLAAHPGGQLPQRAGRPAHEGVDRAHGLGRAVRRRRRGGARPGPGRRAPRSLRGRAAGAGGQHHRARRGGGDRGAARPVDGATWRSSTRWVGPRRTGSSRSTSSASCRPSRRSRRRPTSS